MSSQKQPSILQLLAALVRGPLFLATLSFVLLLAAVPAQAVLLQGYLQTDAPGSATNPLGAAIDLDSFPDSFEGVWRCVTVVVDSAVAGVPIGHQVESELAFLRTGQKVVARWAQPGWTEGQSSITPIGTNEAAVDRTNYFIAEGAARWSARSVDHYKKVDEDRMVAVSEVDQYVAGQFLGKYRTKSLLMRVNGPEHRVAMTK